MDLGQQIREARLTVGLSQRQLCGNVITRNMLSQIENGSAKPSMQTLAYLAQQLGKPISYFLEEQAVTSPNQASMDAARQAMARGDLEAAAEALAQFRCPDGVFWQEWQLLQFLCLTAQGEKALQEGKKPYAATLLQRAGTLEGLYITKELERRRVLLLGQTGAPVGHLLQDEDEALLLRARDALAEGQGQRCLQLLGAVEHSSAQWQLLQAEGLFALGQYGTAAEYYKLAEEAFPHLVYPKLEVCSRELGDFRQAYEYACKQR